MQNSKLQFKIQKLDIKYFIYLILLSLPLYLIKFSVLNIPTTVLEIEIYLLASCFLVGSLLNKSLSQYILRFIANPFFMPWLIFLIAGVISVLVSPDTKTALGIFKAYFFDASLFFYIFLLTIKSKDEVKRCFTALIISAIVLSLIGLTQYLFLPQFLQDGRIRSVFASPNYLSLYIAPISFFCFILFERLKKINLLKSKLLYCYIVILFAIILTFSRGAWLGMLLGLIFFFIMLMFQKLKIKKLKLVFVSLFIIGFVASFYFIIKGSYSFGLVSTNRVVQSDNIRKEIWVTSLDIGSKHLLAGIGLGNFQNYFGQLTKNRINYPEYITPNAVTPHNILLNIWLQMGLLGLLGFMGLLGLFFRECFVGIKKEPIINLILMAAMIAILGQGLVDSAIWKNDLMIVFWFLIGCSYIINKKGEYNGK